MLGSLNIKKQKGEKRNTPKASFWSIFVVVEIVERCRKFVFGDFCLGDSLKY